MPFKWNSSSIASKLGHYGHIVDILWLIALGIYVFAGMMLATFHGDEAMQIYMSRDYATAFIYHDPTALLVGPPYQIDSDSQLRILNGSVNRYVIGLSWQLAGLTTGDLPPRPGWDWGLNYATNADTGHVPSDALMTAARLPSTLFLALSVAVMFGLGWQFGRPTQFGPRPLAYVVSALYVVNPIVLLNGRRAMQEGEMLFFGLLTVLIASLISRKLESEGRVRWFWWLALIVSGALGLASKHPTVIFIAAAYSWIFVTVMIGVIRRRLGAKTDSGSDLNKGFKPLVDSATAQNAAASTSSVEVSGFSLATGLKPVVSLLISGLLTVGLFITLSPALWNDPIARLQDLLAQREWLLDIQVTAQPSGATTLAERTAGIVTQPFLTSLQHFEVASWAQAKPIRQEVRRYMASPLSGVQFGAALGIPLTLLAGFGLLVLFIPRWRPGISAAAAVGIGLWFALIAASLLVNPLPWQRYYLPLIPAVTLLVGIGLTRAALYIKRLPGRIRFLRR